MTASFQATVSIQQGFGVQVSYIPMAPIARKHLQLTPR